MLIKQIYNDMVTARKGSDPVAKSLLVTLYSESSMVGKNKRNGDPTDEETIGVAKKFVANAEETIRLLSERNQDTSIQKKELEILQTYLPKQLTKVELESAIADIISMQSDTGPKIMGKVMSELKARYGAAYDGKLASELVKVALT